MNLYLLYDSTNSSISQRKFCIISAIQPFFYDKNILKNLVIFYFVSYYIFMNLYFYELIFL